MKWGKVKTQDILKSIETQLTKFKKNKIQNDFLIKTINQNIKKNIIEIYKRSVKISLKTSIDNLKNILEKINL